MPARNLLVLLLTTVACVAAWYARERDRGGRRVDEVLALIDAAYIEPVDGDALVAAAVDGAVATLDENSAWLRGDGQRELEAALDQRFGGVGLELAIDDRTGGLTVATPLPGGPAARAGIGAGDRVTAIDGHSTAGMALRDAVARLRGEPGAPVTLSVAPGDGATDSGDAAARDVRLVREVVQVESVEGDRRLPDGTWDWWLEGEPGIALVRITGFGERTAAELEEALARVAAGQFSDAGPPKPLRGVVIDLRGNPGGLVTAAVDVCDLFLDEGVIVSTRGRRQPTRDGVATPPQDVRRANAGAVLAGVPIALLVDGMTASAAEIVAACLQDHGRARVVGSRTYGKGTVQSILPLAGGGLLKLTTSEYLRPDGTSIDRRRDAGADDDWGVSPDDGFAVAPTSASLERLARWRRRRDSAAMRPGPSADPPRAVDEVLARALDALAPGSAPAPDLGGEEEAPGDAHEAAAAGA
ncbi:MAG: S41 family peptidase [Planctomycetaceae bacterium]